MAACPIEVSAVYSPILGKRKIEAEFERYKSQVRGGSAGKSEIDAYLEEEIENDREGFDVLAWWKSKSEKISCTGSNGPRLPCNSFKHGVI